MRGSGTHSLDAAPRGSLRYKTTTTDGKLLWAERNFIPGPESLDELRKNAGELPFEDWKFLGQQRDIKYTYFDMVKEKELPSLVKGSTYALNFLVDSEPKYSRTVTLSAGCSGNMADGPA